LQLTQYCDVTFSAKKSGRSPVPAHSSMPYHDMKKICIGEVGLSVSCVESVGPSIRISRIYDTTWGTLMPALQLCD